MLSGLSYSCGPRFGEKHRGTDTCSEEIVPRMRQELMPFATAVDNGADRIELDTRANPEMIFQVALGKDGKPKFSFMGESIPTLKDVLKVIPPHVKLHLEIKSSTVYLPSRGKKLEKAIAAFIRENNLYDRVLLLSFSPFILRVMEKLDPNIQTMRKWWFPKHHYADGQTFDRAHRNGTPAVPWVSGHHRAEERDNFAMYVRDGADGTVTNTTDAMAHRIDESEAKRAGGIKFGGTRGRNDMQNLLMPDWAIKLYAKHREAPALWAKASGRYDKVTEILRARGLSAETIAGIHRFTENAMGFPKGLHLDLGDEGFKAYYKNLDDEGKEYARYMLDRYGVFIVDHYSGVFENLENDAEWDRLGWFLNGLIAHPQNDHIYFTVQPLGLVTKKLAPLLETKSPYYDALMQLIDYEKAVLDDALMSGETRNADGSVPTEAERQAAYKKEQANFASNVLFDLVMKFPQQYDVNPGVAVFLKDELPRVLATFRENYPAPKIIADGRGDSEYFDKLQKHILQNAMMLVSQSDRMTRPMKPLQRPDGPQRPFVVQHTPLNHLARPAGWREAAR